MRTSISERRGTWKWRVSFTEKMRMTLTHVSKAWLSLNSLLRCVAHIPRCADSSRLSIQLLFTTK